MTRPLLPPRGVFVPTALVYDPHLPAAVRETWIQLRGLAWGRNETPSLSLERLSNLLDKKQSTFYGHMRLLHLRGALRWRTGGRSEIIIVFPQDEELAQSGFLEKPDPPASNDSVDLIQKGSDFDLLESDQINRRIKGDVFQKSGILETGKGPCQPALPGGLDRFVDTLAQVTGMQADLNYPRLARCAGRLHKAGYSAETIASLYALQNSGRVSAWSARDWRGRRGDRPTPEQIEQTVAGLLEPPTGTPTGEEVLRRLAEAEGIDFDDL